MSRQTIDFGIDLGTTNSVIAVAEKGAVEVIKNGLQEITPSMVYIDKKQQTYIGSGATRNLTRMSSVLDVHDEFKREMGTAATRHFPVAGADFTVASLSAMVLKELRKAAEERFGEAPAAAVITVPAKFELPQRDATARAADEAGFKYHILLAEPVAAAAAYGFSTDSDKAYWLVYDFGGGTFDASIVSIRDGQLSVVKHAGDNYLGGADFDRAIIDRFIVPTLRDEYDLDDLDRANIERITDVKRRYKMLKPLAEAIKKDLSRAESCAFFQETGFDDNSGTPVDVDIEITRSQFEEVIIGFVEKSIDITRDLIQDCSLQPSVIEKVLLVGGSTFVPLVQHNVDSLGIDVDRSLDPMTVVARGASIFASSQLMRPDIQPATPVAVGTARIELDYEPVVKELDPPVGGKVLIDGAPPSPGATVVITRDDDGFKSPEVPVNSKGIFFTDLIIRNSGQSTFKIEVRDQNGAKLDVSPDRFAVTYGLPVGKPTLTSGLQIGLADGSVRMLFPSGTSLPAVSGPHTVHTVRDLIKGSGEALEIPILDGDEPEAELNLVGTTFKLEGDVISRDLPAGTPVEVTAEIDISAASTISFTIPLLGETYDNERGPDGPDTITDPDGYESRKELDRLRARIDELIEKGESSGEVDAVAKVRVFASSPAFNEIERLIVLYESSGGVDVVAAGQARNNLLAARKKIGELASLVDWPAKVVEYEDAKDRAKRLVHEHGNASDQSALDTLLAEGERAISAKDGRMLGRAVRALENHIHKILLDHPGYLAEVLQCCAEQQPLSRDPRRFAEILQEANQALRRGDLASVRNIIQQLVSMLPPEARGLPDGGVI
ncbi:MAG: Hsp70 family protein [Phycisphaerales bacterium]|nr:Hsp70 family protein [Phycisphaerales bacterium]